MMKTANGLLLKPEMEHEFHVPTQHGVATIKVPDSEMKVCGCGHGLFRIVHRIGWIKPANVINAKPVCVRVDVYLCDKCGAECGIETHTKRQAALEAT